MPNIKQKRSLYKTKIFYPYSLGAVAAFLWWIFEEPFPENPDLLLYALLAVAGVFMWSMWTALAMLFNIKDAHIMCQLTESGHLSSMVDIFTVRFHQITIFMIVSVYGLALPEIDFAYKIILIISTIVAVLAYVGSFKILLLLLAQIIEKIHQP